MKVLHVHSGNLYGGVETFLLTLARFRHHAPSMEMAAALCFDGRIADELRREGIATSLLEPVRLRRPDSIGRGRRALRRVLDEGHFDAVVCHQAWPIAIFGPVVKTAGVPLVSWIHMAPSGHWIDRLAARVDPDLTICNSHFTASLLPKRTAPVSVVHYPVSAITRPRPSRDRLDFVRHELQTSTDDIVIIQVSRMEALKGQMVCLEALGQLASLRGWTCWQVGGAQRDFERHYFDSLRSAAQRLGISSRVRFAGERNDVPDLLAASDIYCQPNLSPEGFGITFVEAMSAGLPVVTSAIGGALEVVDAASGILVRETDNQRRASATAVTLARLIGDPTACRQMAEAGRRRAVALCDPARQMRRVADALETVCVASHR